MHYATEGGRVTMTIGKFLENIIGVEVPIPQTP